VKICGVTSPEDARQAAAAGADAVGFNFVPGSPRRVEIATAREAVAALPGGVLAVGVFAGAAAEEMVAVARTVGLTAIQLHGHLEADADAFDPPRDPAELAGLPVIRAVRPGSDGLTAARRWLASAAAAGRSPRMLIVDAGTAAGTAAGRLGGTGRLVDWDALAREPSLNLPTALAGGLSPENVAAAIQATGVVAVDTASGVESSPGHKDAGRMLAFVAAARRALGHQG